MNSQPHGSFYDTCATCGRSLGENEAIRISGGRPYCRLCPGAPRKRRRRPFLCRVVGLLLDGDHADRSDCPGSPGFGSLV